MTPTTETESEGVTIKVCDSRYKTLRWLVGILIFATGAAFAQSANVAISFGRHEAAQIQYEARQDDYKEWMKDSICEIKAELKAIRNGHGNP